MTGAYYEIRHCMSCGLRYPLVGGHPFGKRCPSCLGDTENIRREQLSSEIPIIENKLPWGIKLHVFLDNIRSAWNVGSILRTAEGLSFEHAYLGGITPTPEQPEVRKTALGAEASVAWTVHRNGLEKIRELQEARWQIVALERVEGSTPIETAFQRLERRPSVLVVGNEITGVDVEILGLAERVVHIPMRGKKRSLNVEVAFGIAAYQLRCALDNQ